MQVNPVYSRESIERINERLGSCLRISYRVLATMLLIGLVGMWASLSVLNFAKTPEKWLHLEGFSANYTETASHNAQVAVLMPTSQKPQAGLSLKTQRPLPLSSGKNLKDPNWDGALAGANMGAFLGGQIPLVGPVLGPVVGAWLGYQLDSHI